MFSRFLTSSLLIRYLGVPIRLTFVLWQNTSDILVVCFFSKDYLSSLHSPLIYPSLIHMSMFSQSEAKKDFSLSFTLDLTLSRSSYFKYILAFI